MNIIASLVPQKNRILLSKKIIKLFTKKMFHRFSPLRGAGGAFLLLLFTQCNTIKPELISYNQQKNFFEYKSIPLRNDNMFLVDSSNIEQFKIELSKRKNTYPFKYRTEETDLIRYNDFNLASIYSATQKALLSKDFAAVLSGVYMLRYGYSDAEYYTDCLFLEANAYEQMGMTDSAKARYDSFLNLSSQKYSARFQGYRFYDYDDSDLVKERNHAMAFINNFQYPVENCNAKPIVPKYYFGSFQPGYLANEDELDPYKDNAHVSFFVDQDMYNNISFGVYSALNFKNKIIPTLLMKRSINASTIGISVPIQVYKSKTNRLAIKCSPFFSSTTVFELADKDSVYYNNFLPDAGLRISAGYYLVPNVSIGAYYEYHYFNKQNPFYFDNTALSFSWKNEYDVSMYYNVFRNFTLKAGVKNNDFVLGFFNSGVELSWSILKRGFVLRTSLL